MADGDDMKVCRLIGLEKDQVPVTVGIDLHVAAKRQLFALVRSRIANYSQDEFAAELLRSLADEGCLITRGHWTRYMGIDDDLELAAAGIFPPNDDSAWISVIVSPDFRTCEGLPVTPTWPIGFFDPDAFSCSWDPDTEDLVYNGLDD